MNLFFDFDGNSFIAGMVAIAALIGVLSIYWLIAVPFILTSFGIKGMPFAKLTFKSGEGWKLIKGRY